MSLEKTSWASPPFNVHFEDFDERDLPDDPPPPRQTTRVRDKFILAAAVILFFFIWPISPLDTPDNQIALTEPPRTNTTVQQQPDAAPQLPDAVARERKQPAGVQER